MEGIKYKQMQVFIECAQEYEYHSTEIGKTMLLKQLQFLSTAADMSVFDPGSPITSQFYMLLYELMKQLESHNSLIWTAVSCLKHACSNTAARVALTHTYKFNQILARFLSPLPPHDKLVQLLCLLEDISYGIKFNWQEAHLPGMMKTLAALITAEDKTHLRAALTIMINLCYKNLPAVYALIRTVDQTSFLSTITTLGKEDIYTHVQVFKLLFTLEYVSDEITDEDIVRFVSETFVTLGDAFKAGNVVLMRQIVDFFHDVQTNAQTKLQVLSYSNFVQDTNKLMDLLECSSQDPQRVGVLFEFAHSLVALKISHFYELYPLLVHLSLGYIHTESASTSALYLIQEIVADKFIEDDIKTKIMTALDGHLEIILLSLKNQGDSENRSRLTALMNLLKTACANPAIRERVLNIVRPDIIYNLFYPLLNRSTKLEDENIFEPNYSKFYVYLLDFVTELVSNIEFKNMLSSLLQQKNIQMILSLAVYIGREEIKTRVFTMIRTEYFPSESIVSLCRTMCELEPLVMQFSDANKNKKKTHLKLFDEESSTPLFGPSQEVRLNELINQTSEMMDKAKNGESVLTSSLMKLYEYKLASVSHNERQLESHLEAATCHSTHLQHQLAQVSSEASRLQREIYYKEQYIVDLGLLKQETEKKFKDSLAALENYQERNMSNIETNESLIKDLQQTVDDQTKALQIKTDQLNIAVEEAQNKGKELLSLRGSHKQLAEANDALISTVSDREATLEDLKKRLDGKDTEIALLLQESNNIKKEKSSLEKIFEEKEDRLRTVQLQLDSKMDTLGELERMRKRIFEMATPKPGLPAVSKSTT